MQTSTLSLDVLAEVGSRRADADDGEVDLSDRQRCRLDGRQRGKAAPVGVQVGGPECRHRNGHRHHNRPHETLWNVDA